MNGKVLKNNRCYTTLASAKRRAMILAVLRNLGGFLGNHIILSMMILRLIDAGKRYEVHNVNR